MAHEPNEESGAKMNFEKVELEELTVEEAHQVKGGMSFWDNGGTATT
jgi:hypothetical protein